VEAALLYAAEEGPADPGGAAEHLGAAIARQPERYDLYDARATLDVRTGALEEARRRLDAILAKWPDQPALLVHRASILVALGDLDAAARDAQAARRLAPAQNAPARTLARVYARQTRVGEAIAELEAARADGNTGSDALLLGHLYLEKGEPERALASWEQALTQPQPATGARFGLLAVLADLGRDLDRAHELAQRAVLELPTSPEAADALGIVQLRRGETGRALTQFDRAIGLPTPGRGGPEPLHYYHAGLAFEARGKVASAIASYEIARQFGDAFARQDEVLARLTKLGAGPAPSP